MSRDGYSQTFSSNDPDNPAELTVPSVIKRFFSRPEGLGVGIYQSSLELTQDSELVEISESPASLVSSFKLEDNQEMVLVGKDETIHFPGQYSQDLGLHTGDVELFIGEPKPLPSKVESAECDIKHQLLTTSETQGSFDSNSFPWIQEINESNICLGGLNISSGQYVLDTSFITKNIEFITLVTTNESNQVTNQIDLTGRRNNQHTKQIKFKVSELSNLYIQLHPATTKGLNSEVEIQDLLLLSIDPASRNVSPQSDRTTTTFVGQPGLELSFPYTNMSFNMAGSLPTEVAEKCSNSGSMV